MTMAEPETAVDLGPAARRLADLVAHVPDDALLRPTPCPAYSLGDLIEHVGGLALAFTAAARKERSTLTEINAPGDALRLGGDWRERIPSDLTALAKAWAEPAAWTGMTRIAGDDSPAAVVGLVLADELAVHGWDVARASGQAYELDDTSVQAVHGFLTGLAQPGNEAMRGGIFGPVVAVPEDAPLLDRTVGLAGRHPGWSPS